MMTFAVILMSLMVLGVATHFVPALRRGRVGYPPSPSSPGSAGFQDPPRTRKPFEFALSPRRELEFVACDKICDGV